MADRQQRIDDLFARALSCHTAERSALLHQECGDDAELRAEVEQLIAADAQASREHFLEAMMDSTGAALLSLLPGLQAGGKGGDLSSPGVEADEVGATPADAAATPADGDTVRDEGPGVGKGPGAMAATDHNFADIGGIDAAHDDRRPAAPLLDNEAKTRGAAFAPEAKGSLIGPYRLLEKLGEGGMGVVYLAEQGRPVRRRVALKIIKPGMDTHQVVARFEAERQALALMDHPHIARVLDAGATELGRPFFVMELVHGMPITDYCDQARLSVRDRLKLFVTVCRAVQHAHQQGVIHRDIKPTNVLVALHDGLPAAKVIDFGIAKAIGQQLTERTLHTGLGMIGTPAYMSPEQVGAGQDVDTRSDVYSLGVLLYELLTGRAPLDRTKVREASLEELRRLIQEVEPPLPSNCVGRLDDAEQAIVAERRGCEPRKLAPLLRGELDWLVTKSLEKDRSRRYESPSALADDMERYLRNDAVQACPPSAAYQVRKFVQRNRGLVTAGLVGAVVLLAGTLMAVALLGALSKQKLADQLRQQEANARAAEQYLRTLSQVRTLQSQAEFGWTWEALAKLHELGDIKTGVTLPKELRDVVAGCLSAFDIRPKATLLTDRRSYCVAFSPDSRLLAVGESLKEINDPLRVTLVSVGDGPDVASESIQFAIPPHPVTVNNDLRPDGVRCLAFHKDWLYAGTRSGWVYRWNWRDPQAKPVGWAAHGRPIHNVLPLPDGSGVLTKSEDKLIHRWEWPAAGKLASAAATAVIDSDSDDGMAISADGTRIAYCDRELHVLDAETLQPKDGPDLSDLISPLSPVFSPDGDMLLAWTKPGRSPVSGQSEDGGIRVYSGGELRTNLVRIGPAQYDREAMLCSPDGSVIATVTGEGRIQFWDLATGKSAGQVFVNGVRRPAFSPDGRYFAAIGAGLQEVKLFEVRGLETQSVRSTLGHFSRPLFAAAASPREPSVACIGFTTENVAVTDEHGCHRGAVRYYDFSASHRRREWLLPLHAGGTASMAFAHLSPYLLATSAHLGNHACYGFDLQSLRAEPLSRFNHAVSLRYARAADRLFTIGPGNTSHEQQGNHLTESHVIASWKTPREGDWFLFDNTPAAAIHGRRGIHAIDVGTNYLVAGTRGGQVLLFGIDSTRKPATPGNYKLEQQFFHNTPPMAEIHLPAQVYSVAIAPDESVAVAGVEDGTLHLLRLPDLCELQVCRQHAAAVTAVSFSPDGSLLATGSNDHSVRLWMPQEGQLEELVTLQHGDAIQSVSIGYRSTLMSVLVKGERAARVWHLDQLRDKLAPYSLGWPRATQAAIEPAAVTDLPTEEITTLDSGPQPSVGNEVQAPPAPPAWTWNTLANLAEARKAKSDPKSVRELREQFATCLSSFDLRLRAKSLPEHNSFCLAFSPDSRYLALGHAIQVDGPALPTAVTLVPMDESDHSRGPARQLGRLSRDIRGPRELQSNSVRSLAFHSHWLYAGTRDGWVHRWDYENPQAEPLSWQAHADEIFDLLPIPDGTGVITRGRDKTIHRWELGTDNKAPSQPAATAAIETEDDTGSALSADGMRVAYANDRVNILDAKTLRRLGDPQPEQRGELPRFPVFAPNSELLLAWTTEGINVFGARTGRNLVALNSALEPRQALITSSDGSLLATATSEGIKFWDLASGRMVCSMPAGNSGQRQSLAFSGDGRFFAAVSDGRTQLFELRGLTDESVRSTLANHPKSLYAAATSPSDPVVACLGYSGPAASQGRFERGTVGLYDLATGRRRVVPDFPVRYNGTGTLAFNPRSPHLMAMSAGRGYHPVFDIHLEDFKSTKVHESLCCLALRWSADGRKLYTIDRGNLSAPDQTYSMGHVISSSDVSLKGGWFRYDNALTGSVGQVDAIHSIGVANKYLVAGTARRQVLLFDVDPPDQPSHYTQNAVPLRELRLPTEVYAVDVTPDESLAVAGAADGILRVLRLPDLREVGAYHEHSAAIRTIHISHDGSLIATGSDDGTVRLWLRIGERLEELMALPHGGPIRSVSIGHGSRLLSVLVKNERAARVWRLDRLHDELAVHALGWREPYRRQPGWTWDAMAKSLESHPPEADAGGISERRGALATSSSSFDLRLKAKLLSGDKSSCVAFSPNSQYLGVGQAIQDDNLPLPLTVTLVPMDIERSRDRPLQLAVEPKEVRINGELRPDGIRSLAFQGDWLYAGTRSGWVYRWKYQDPQATPLSWPAHAEEIFDLLAVPESPDLLSRSKDKSIRRWEFSADGTSPPKLVAAAPLRTDGDNGTAVAIDNIFGNPLVAYADDHLHVLDAATLKTLKDVKSQDGSQSPQCPVITPDGELLLAWTNRGIDVFGGGDVGQNVVPMRPILDRRQALVASPDGSILATGTSGGQIEFWELASGRRLAQVPVADSPYYRKLAFSPDGRHFAATSGNGVQLFELRGVSKARPRVRGKPSAPYPASLADERVLSTLGHYSRPLYAAEASPIRPAVACMGYLRESLTSTPLRNGSVRFYDLSEMRQHPLMDGVPLTGATIGTLTFNPRTARLITTPGGAGTRSHYYDLPSFGMVHHTLDIHYGLALRFAADGKRLYSIDRGDTGPEAWNDLPHDAGHVISSWQESDLTRDRFRFDNSADMPLDDRRKIHSIDVVARRLIASTAGARVLLFDVDPAATDRSTKPEQPKAPVPMREVRIAHEAYTVALTPDESIAAIGLGDGTVRLLRLPELAEVAVYRRHAAAVRSVRFSPDGSLLATGSDDHTVRLWRRNGDRLEELLVLPHNGPIRSVSLGHQGSLLTVLVQRERAMRVWNLDRLHEELAKHSRGWR